MYKNKSFRDIPVQFENHFEAARNNNSNKKRVSCRDCIHYDSQDYSCSKKPYVFRNSEDSILNYKNCEFFDVNADYNQLTGSAKEIITSNREKNISYNKSKHIVEINSDLKLKIPTNIQIIKPYQKRCVNCAGTLNTNYNITIPVYVTKGNIYSLSLNSYLKCNHCQICYVESDALYQEYLLFEGKKYKKYLESDKGKKKSNIIIVDGNKWFFSKKIKHTSELKPTECKSCRCKLRTVNSLCIDTWEKGTENTLKTDVKIDRAYECDNCGRIYVNKENLEQLIKSKVYL